MRTAAALAAGAAVATGWGLVLVVVAAVGLLGWVLTSKDRTERLVDVIKAWRQR